MIRLRLLFQSFGLTLVISFLISCGSSSAFVTPTEHPIPKDSNEVPRISVQDLKTQLDRGEAILIVDARSESSFQRRHIAGAISVPASEVRSRLDEFPRDQEIVFY